MNVGILQVELFIPHSGSLKSKRHVLRSLKDRIRQRFNVSVSEVDGQDKWQRAVLGIACVGCDKPYINGTLSRISDLIEQQSLAQVTDIQLEIL